MLNNKFTIIIISMLIIFTTPAFSGDESETAMRKILEGEHRSDANKTRDKYRHPVETLTWLGIKDNMSVVEIFPGGGWYTEILAPFLKDKGTFYAAGNDPDSSVRFFRKSASRFKEKVESNKDVYGNVNITILAPPDKTEIAPEGTADMVLTFRNIHNWMKGGYADDVYSAMYKALKPGGVLGVVEHRGNPEINQDPKANSGYVNQDYAIKLAEKAGFKFVGSSEINANSKDTKDYPKDVWTLPPTLRLKDKDRNKYMEIGRAIE